MDLFWIKKFNIFAGTYQKKKIFAGNHKRKTQKKRQYKISSDKENKAEVNRMHHKKYTNNTVYEIDNENFQINPYFLRIFLVSKLKIEKSI